MATTQITSREETLESLYHDLLNKKISELPSPSKDIIIPVPGDGKCGWWTLSINFNILLVCGHLDQVAQNNPAAYQRLLDCINTIHKHIALSKHETPPVDITTIDELKRLLLSKNTMRQTNHGANLTWHQEFMAPALKLFLYTKPEYYTACIDKASYDSTIASLITNPDNNKDSFISEPEAIARILREESSTIAGIHEWVSIEDMSLFMDLGIHAVVSRQPILPANTLQNALNYAVNHPESVTQKNGISNPFHHFKDLREEYKHKVLDPDGQIKDNNDNNAVLFKAVLTGESFFDSCQQAGGADPSEYTNEASMHFWAKMPLAIYNRAADMGLILPNYKKYFSIHVGNAHKYLDNKKDLAEETHDENIDQTIIGKTLQFLSHKTTLVFGVVLTVLIACNMPQVALALFATSMVILGLKNLFSDLPNTNHSVHSNTPPLKSSQITIDPKTIKTNHDKDLNTKNLAQENTATKPSP